MATRDPELSLCARRAAVPAAAQFRDRAAHLPRRKNNTASKLTGLTPLSVHTQGNTLISGQPKGDHHTPTITAGPGGGRGACERIFIIYQCPSPFRQV